MCKGTRAGYPIGWGIAWGIGYPIGWGKPLYAYYNYSYTYSYTYKHTSKRTVWLHARLRGLVDPIPSQSWKDKRVCCMEKSHQENQSQ